MAVVRVRQLQKRHSNGEPLSCPHVMFPNIQRCHADQDLRTCFKYLLNYGFYKFGVEVGKSGFATKCTVVLWYGYSLTETVVALPSNFT
jgi:hypothetical protein